MGYIEPLIGVLRDPRVFCNHSDVFIFSVDWIVFPDAHTLIPGGKSRFYDAGGSTFKEALDFFLETYTNHGIVFDEVYVWEAQKQGATSYWHGVSADTRSFWESRLKFFDGVLVNADSESGNNPVAHL